MISDPFDSTKNYIGAYNTQTSELEFELQAIDSSGKYFIHAENVDPNTPANTGSNGSGSQNARLHNSFVQGGRGNDIFLAGQGRDEIEGGIGDDFIDGGSESEFLSKFVGTTAAATKVK